MKYVKEKKLKYLLLLFVTVCFSVMSVSQNTAVKSPLVDFDAYQDILKEVKEHRKSRLVTASEFREISKEKNVIILDTRSDAMYKALHIKGAIHLNFSDFTQSNLAKTIPSMDTKILIYCNNNFDNSILEPVDFSKYYPSKSVSLALMRNPPQNIRAISLALNIPTYINLYGYGYRNVYELSDYITSPMDQVELEGEAFKPLTINRDKTK